MNRNGQIQNMLRLLLALTFAIPALTFADSWYMPMMNDDEWEEWNWDDDWEEGDKSTGDIRYNRVEGLYLGYQIKQDYFRKHYPGKPFVFGKTGYSFGNKEFQYQAGLEKGFMDDYRFAFGVEYHRLIDSEDHWLMPVDENSLAAVLLKEDFYDYYLTEGNSFYVTQRITPVFQWTAGYYVDAMESCKKRVNWSLFGGRSKFRSNPLMSEGEIRAAKASFVIDTRNSKKKTTRGWYLLSQLEHASEDFNGDFIFDRMILDWRRYQPLGYGDGLDIRLRAGSATGCVPWQHSFQLGGISTMRGFKYKELTGGPLMSGGNRMLLAQFEYRMGNQDLPDEVDLGILEHFNLILFTDIGWVDHVNPDWDFYEGFDTIDLENLKNDVGVALANRSGDVRFEIARRTDTADKPFVFYFRLNRSF